MDNDYKIIRCDTFTPEEFREYMRTRAPRRIAEEYMEKHPKSTYTIDDEIEIIHMGRDRKRHISKDKRTRGMLGGGRTSKRFTYPGDDFDG